jgi:lipopolysaccharide export system protein LptC
LNTDAPPTALLLNDLPDLAAQAGHGRWHLRQWRDLLSAYLPILIMAVLALATWWLVKRTPGPAGPQREATVRHEPDYAMENFTLTRYDSQGRFKARIAGRRMRHFPDRDQVEIEEVHIHAQAGDGRFTDATARRALTNGDASELELIGAAHVRVDIDGSDALVVDGEWLHLYLNLERLRSTQAVVVRRAGSVVRAAGLDYDHLDRKLRFAGPLAMELTGRSGAGAAAPAAKGAR